MKILITGANGLVGKSSQKIFYEKNIDFSIVSSKESFIPGIKRYKSLLDVDVKENYDVLIHASAATPNNANFENIYDLNKKIDNELKEYIENSKTKHVFYISTMAIYGEIKLPEISEYTTSNYPNKYGLSKLEGEKTVSKICESKGIKLSILRLPGVISQGMPPVFFKRAVQNIACGDPITIRSFNSKFNNCIFVDDIALTILNLINKQIFDHLILNLHSKDVIDIGEMLSFLSEKLRIKPLITESLKCNPSFVITNKENGNLLVTRTVKECISSFFKSFS